MSIRIPFRSLIKQFLLLDGSDSMAGYHKADFILSLPPNASILDLGCGNSSPMLTKQLRPDIYYVGLDVADYNQTETPDQFADEYHIVSPDKFAPTVEQYQEHFDAVISSHNLEHCDEPERVLRAMAKCLKSGGGGRLYLAFPCEASTSFPKRGFNSICLNFYDDSSHIYLPKWEHTLNILASGGLHFQFLARRYRIPKIYRKALIRELLGMYIFPKILQKGSDYGVWNLYGFESVIWGEKK